MRFYQAAQINSSWKNFNLILVYSQKSRKKDALFWAGFIKEAIRPSLPPSLLFVGDLNRAEKGLVSIPDTFNLKGWKDSSLLQ